MKKGFRFLLGIGGGILSIVIVALLIALFIPLAIIGGLLFSVVGLILVILYVIAIGFAFVWFLTEKRPEYNMKKNYSIKQGREI